MSYSTNKFPKKQRDFYQKIRTRINKWFNKKRFKHKYSKYILLAPDFFHLLCKLVKDPRVPTKKKAKLIATIAYFIFPFDAFPEAIFGPAGYIDDIMLTAYVLNDLINEIDEEIVKNHWAGEGDVLSLIQELLKLMDDILGKNLWEEVKKKAFS